MQAEVTTLSQQVGLCDHQRAILTAENVLLKQKLTSLGQTQRFKEGECFFGVLSNLVEECYQHEKASVPILCQCLFSLAQALSWC